MTETGGTAMAGRRVGRHARFTTRWATLADVAALGVLIAQSIDRLQGAFLTTEQIVASHAFMGLDTQLVQDGAYLVVERDGRLAGCGGWSRRTTLYGGDDSVALRDPALLDPSRDPARIRAMYTHPDFVRQGVGRLILAVCEQAAASAGFRAAELMATMSGVPLYAACGYEAVETVANTVGEVGVPFVRMRKSFLPVGP